MKPRRKSLNRAGFSLLETIFALFLFSLFIAAIVPVWIAIQRGERLADNMQRASELAADQMETVHDSDIVQTTSKTVREEQTEYQIRTQTASDAAGTWVRVIVSFRERGDEHAVSYESVIP